MFLTLLLWISASLAVGGAMGVPKKDKIYQPGMKKLYLSKQFFQHTVHSQSSKVDHELSL